MDVVTGMVFKCDKGKYVKYCIVSNCGPLYFSTKKFVIIRSKLIFFSFKTT